MTFSVCAILAWTEISPPQDFELKSNKYIQYNTSQEQFNLYTLHGLQSHLIQKNIWDLVDTWELHLRSPSNTTKEQRPSNNIFLRVRSTVSMIFLCVFGRSCERINNSWICWLTGLNYGTLQCSISYSVCFTGTNEDHRDLRSVNSFAYQISYISVIFPGLKEFSKPPAS